MTRFSNKVALVTGGTGGMGLVVARMLRSEGAHVIICGRNVEKGLQLRENGEIAQFLQCDVSDPESVHTMVDQVVRKHGRIDCAFNNAGISPQHALVADSSTDEWKRVLDVNLNGIYYCMRAEISAMRRLGGSIVNNSSVAGVMAIPGQAAYVASKFAVVGLTQAAAIEYARADESGAAIRVNAVAPGPISGGMNNERALALHPERTKRKVGATAMHRFGEPEEVAAAVLWLLSDAASYLTGTVLPVDGGATAGKF